MMSCAETSRAFLDWLDAWYTALAPVSLESVVSDPGRAALCSVDLINGFAYEGNLSTPRVAGIVPRVVDLFERAHTAGVRNLLLVQECHTPSAEEFKAFGPHGICGTNEAETVPALSALPFASEFLLFHKNSLHTITDTLMEGWLREHAEVDTYIITGDCTDLCAYDLAMGLKLRANQRDIPRRVVVPENCVQTYDLPVEIARHIGVLPHDGDLLHRMFLYMMALNKIEVVKEIC